MQTQRGENLKEDRLVRGISTTDKWRKIMIQRGPLARREARPHWRCSFCRTHVVGKELQHKSGHTAVDPDEEVHAGEDHVGCAGDLEHERGWVHERCDRPPGEARRQMSTGCPLPLLGLWAPYAFHPSRGALPVQQKQKGQHRQVGRGHVGLLLEADEDDNDQRGRDHVVALKVKQGNKVHP